MLIKRILIPTEDRDLTQATLSHIRPLMKHSQAEVILLRVVPPDERDLGRRGKRVESAQRDLTQTCELLRNNGFRATGDWAEGADPAATIVDRANELHASLIVQATHARRDLERWSRGSVTERVLRHASVPMLVFNPWNRFSEFRTILVPVDGSERAGRILPLVIAFAQSYGSEVILLRVGAISEPGAQIDVGALEAGVASCERALIEAKVRTRTVIVPAPSVALAILDVAEEEGAELIAMTSHGESEGRWPFGSTAAKVFRHSPLPLLIKRVARLEPPPALDLAPVEARPKPQPEAPRRVLVPLDGSKLAAAVLRALPGLLEGRDADVTLLRVVPQWIAHPKQAVDAARASLKDVAARLSTPALRMGVQVQLGDPSEQILRETRELQPDLVIMSSHGRSGLARWVRGSVAELVLRGCSAPLLLLNTSTLDESAWEHGLPLSRILVPHDGSRFSASILPHVGELAALHQAEVVLLRVADRESDDPHAEREAARERLLLTLADDLAGLRSAGIMANAQVAFGRAADEILDAAGGFDLVALTSHGRTGPARWIFGSVAETVLRHCARPLLVVRG